MLYCLELAQVQFQVGASKQRLSKGPLFLGQFQVGVSRSLLLVLRFNGTDGQTYTEEAETESQAR